MGSRVSKAPKNAGRRKVPLQGVCYRLQVWLNAQCASGREPRPTSVRSRCALELATEIGTQRALERVNPGKFQEYVLKAAKRRLEFLQEHAGTRKVQDWTNETLLPRIGGRKRLGQKFNSAKNPPSALKCELQWQTMDYAINMVQNATEEQLAVLVQDTAGFQAKRARTRIVHTDATAVWLKLRGEEPVVAPDHVLSRQQATRCQTHKFKQRAKYVKSEE